MSKAKKTFYNMNKNIFNRIYSRFDIYDICVPYIMELEEKNEVMLNCIIDEIKFQYQETDGPAGRLLYAYSFVSGKSIDDLDISESLNKTNEKELGKLELIQELLDKVEHNNKLCYTIDKLVEKNEKLWKALITIHDIVESIIVDDCEIIE